MVEQYNQTKVNMNVPLCLISAAGPNQRDLVGSHIDLHPNDDELLVMLMRSMSDEEGFTCYVEFCGAQRH